ncbi:hypothetical protein Pla144_03600 [Bythopirellula polymerisocia]|uniref:Uncharacterized protein n=1 Tax=Bythopirellula polymerisocia TaxID=2528003 RepID=A0A5C6CY93_9BACT|nr:hypothetical protein Pla144_03600 [Bythopirellula polymerisocia]
MPVVPVPGLVLERTFAWLGHSRRLSKDYEELVENSEALVQKAMIRLMLQRLCQPALPQKNVGVCQTLYQRINRPSSS